MESKIATVEEVHQMFSSVMCGKEYADSEDVLEFFTRVMRDKDLPLRTRIDAGADVLRAYKEKEETPAEALVFFTGKDGILRNGKGEEFGVDDRGYIKAVSELSLDAGGFGTTAYKQASAQGK